MSEETRKSDCGCSCGVKSKKASAITLKLTLSQLRDLFDLDTREFDDIFGHGFLNAYVPSDGDLIEEFGDEVLSHESAQEIYDEFYQAVQDAAYSGAEKAFNTAVEDQIYAILDTFKDFGHVEYSCLGDSGYSAVSKEVVGISSYTQFSFGDMEPELEVTVNEDIFYLINYLISCEGMFEVSCDEEPSAEYIKSHLHYLNVLWECEGGRKPGFSIDDRDPFDHQYYNEKISEISKTYGL